MSTRHHRIEPQAKQPQLTKQQLTMNSLAYATMPSNTCTGGSDELEVSTILTGHGLNGTTTELDTLRPDVDECYLEASECLSPSDADAASVVRCCEHRDDQTCNYYYYTNQQHLISDANTDYKHVYDQDISMIERESPETSWAKQQQHHSKQHAQRIIAYAYDETTMPVSHLASDGSDSGAASSALDDDSFFLFATMGDDTYESAEPRKFMHVRNSIEQQRFTNNNINNNNDPSTTTTTVNDDMLTQVTRCSMCQRSSYQSSCSDANHSSNSSNSSQSSSASSSNFDQTSTTQCIRHRHQRPMQRPLGESAADVTGFKVNCKSVFKYVMRPIKKLIGKPPVALKEEASVEVAVEPINWRVEKHIAGSGAGPGVNRPSLGASRRRHSQHFAVYDASLQTFSATSSSSSSSSTSAWEGPQRGSPLIRAATYRTSLVANNDTRMFLANSNVEYGAVTHGSHHHYRHRHQPQLQQQQSLLYANDENRPFVKCGEIVEYVI